MRCCASPTQSTRPRLSILNNKQGALTPHRVHMDETDCKIRLIFGLVLVESWIWESSLSKDTQLLCSMLPTAKWCATDTSVSIIMNSNTSRIGQVLRIMTDFIRSEPARKEHKHFYHIFSRHVAGLENFKVTPLEELGFIKTFCSSCLSSALSLQFWHIICKCIAAVRLHISKASPVPHRINRRSRTALSFH